MSTSKFLFFLLLPLQLMGGLSFFHDVGFTVGPETYCSVRKKDGGTKQDGILWGVRGSVERILPWAIYLGAEGAFAKGTSEGHTGGGAPIRSRMSDYYYEGRFGFAFPWKYGFCGTVTPYLMYGRFVGINDFLDPSPLTLKYRNSFCYGGGGVVIQFQISSCMTVSVRGSVSTSLQARSQITQDPFADDATLFMNEELQYTLELPFQYSSCICRKMITCGITPFFRKRHYGGRESFPSDFFDTKFHIYGTRLDISYLF